MGYFISMHGEKIVGVLKGWDRLSFRDTLGRGVPIRCREWDIT
jgi:hypothetical protein